MKSDRSIGWEELIGAGVSSKGKIKPNHQVIAQHTEEMILHL